MRYGLTKGRCNARWHLAEAVDDIKGRHTPEVVGNLATLVASGRKFRTVYADPPWEYGKTVGRAAAQRHYRTMTLDEICAEPVAKLVEDKAHLHLWTTNGFLREAFEVIDAWGFEYKSCFVWVKTQLGVGNYWRVSHEFLLLGVRGKLPFADRCQRSWMEAVRTAHSHKPGVIRCIIEKVSPSPYLELYGREEIHESNWSVFGNQVERRLF